MGFVGVDDRVGVGVCTGVDVSVAVKSVVSDSSTVIGIKDGPVVHAHRNAKTSTNATVSTLRGVLKPRSSRAAGGCKLWSITNHNH